MADDTITLGGQTLYVRGPVSVKPTSDITAGLKVGRATYDERLHAYYLVLDDFSGGMGHRRLDIAEGVGTIWDNNGGVDVRWPRRVTLPPLVTQVNPDVDPSSQNMHTIGPRYGNPCCLSSLGASYPTTKGWLFVGIGDCLYSVDHNRSALTKEDSIGTGAGGASVRISSVFEFKEPNTTNRKLYYCGTDGAAGTVMRRSADPTGAWADASAKCVESAIPWNEMIIASIPVARIVFSTNGADWNDDDADDGIPIWDGSGSGAVDFLGVSMTPWGFPGIYFLNVGQLYVLDFYARTAQPIEIGNKIRLVAGAVWQDSIVVTDGWNVWQYMAGMRDAVRWMGLVTDNGLPDSVKTGRITNFISEDENLYAIYSLITTGKTRLLGWSGAGWTTLGPEISSYYSMFGYIDALPVLGAEDYSRRLWLFGSTALDGTNVDGRAYSLPRYGGGPLKGTDSFSDGPLYFTTGWMDMGFRELSGVLYRMYIDGYNFSSTSTVKIYYRLDNDESAAWVQMKTSAGAALTFDSTADVGYFATTNPSRGTEFRTVQLKIEIDRGDTATDTPELSAIVIIYKKKPPTRKTFSFAVDVSRMIELGTQVDGSDATWENVWEKLVTLKDTHPLIALYVPSLMGAAETADVEIVDLPASLEDFKTVVGGQGAIRVQCLEPV